MVVGEGNVGKTSLLKCFKAINAKLEPTDQNQATDGIEIGDLNIPLKDKRVVTFKAWYGVS